MDKVNFRMIKELTIFTAREGQCYPTQFHMHYFMEMYKHSHEMKTTEDSE